MVNLGAFLYYWAKQHQISWAYFRLLIHFEKLKLIFLFLTMKAACVHWKAQVLTWGLQNQDKGEENVSLASCTKISGGTKILSNTIDINAIFQKSKRMQKFHD